MEEQTDYGVSYIASAPEELKVGDRVEVIDAPDVFYLAVGKKGLIASFDKRGNAYISVGGDDPGTIIAPSKYLRKIPNTILFDEKDNPLEKQVGGNHYKDMAIQPVEFCMKNNLNFCVSSAIKYLCRYQNKNGKQDLEKAKHFIDLLIQLEYPE